MRELRVDVFDQTSDAKRLRFSVDAGRSFERLLSQGHVAGLVAEVDEIYRADSLAIRSFGSAALRRIGVRLFEFLDGDDRWLSEALKDRPEALLRIATAEEGLRHLPWELLAAGGSFLGVHEFHRFTPVRVVSSEETVRDPSVANRPLRVLFMAASPEGVRPELNFEAEEAMILEATKAAGAEIVVEESGSLEGLRYVIEAYGPGHFDVLHLSGHASVAHGEPVFGLEDEVGGLAEATADKIAEAVGGLWPRLVFVSGCMTALSPGQGALPSMSESLVRAGASTVLGWALPVGDTDASLFEASLYGELAAGRPVGYSVAKARYDLHAAESAFWHFSRLYVDGSPLGSLVTVANTPGRARIAVVPAANDFLDPATGLVKVASRRTFVGRRRLIQRCLRTLREPVSDPAAPEGLVLSGMGGLGKSTLASRLVERMPTHKRAVLVGRIDESAFRQMVARIDFDSLAAHQEAAAILNAPETDLATRVRFMMRGPMATTPTLFVFDDFEYGNLEERDGGHVCSAEANEVLSALLGAIRATNSPSRVIVTSRYAFRAPPGNHLQIEALETLNPNELKKKLNELEHLRPGSVTEPGVRDRTIDVAAGNPRLLEWLDRVIGVGDLDVPDLLAAIEHRAAEFREDVLAQKLLDAQPVAAQRLIAQLNVVDLPVPFQIIEAISDDPPVASHVERSAALGLIESGRDPGTNEPRYLVSNVLRPLLTGILTEDERRQACAAAARALYALWCQS